jgi:hypothetical protein
MTRVRFIVAVVITLAAIGFAVVAMLPPAPGVRQANYDRLEMGMTLAEVEGIYGRHADVTMQGDQRWRCSSRDLAFVAIRRGCLAAKSWPEADETILRKIRR